MTKKAAKTGVALNEFDDLNDSLEQQLDNSIKHFSSAQRFDAVNRAMAVAFTDKELLLHSVSGKPNHRNGAGPVKPPFHPSKFAIIHRLLLKQFPDLDGDRRALQKFMQ